MRTLCHFSCGAASAVATKLILSQDREAEVVILNAFVVEEDRDNRRFLADCEKWFNHPITVLREQKYGASVHEVWRKRRFLNGGIMGASCSVVLKHELMDALALPDDIHALGYTAEETVRADRFAAARPTLRVSFPLIERGLTHADCLAMVERAGIEIPRMYRLGYRNANCVGCCKGGEGYWNKIRVDFPETFIAVQEIQESIGPNSYFFRDRKTGERIGLKQLDRKAGREQKEPEISCSFFCDMAEQDIANG